MKKSILSIAALLMCSIVAFCQGGQKWSESLNSISLGDGLGTSNNQPLKIYVNNLWEASVLTNGNVQFNSLRNNGSGVVTYDSSGTLKTLAFSGNPSDIMSGAGTWVASSSFSQWLTNGNNIYYTNGNVGIGLSNPTYPLTVQGSALINGDLFATNVAASQSLTVGTFRIVDGATDSVVSISPTLNLASDSVTTSNSLSAGVKGLNPITISSGQITSVLGNISFANNNLTTTGAVNAGIINTPALNVADSITVPVIKAERIATYNGDSLIRFGDSSIVMNLVSNNIYSEIGPNIPPFHYGGISIGRPNTVNGNSIGGTPTIAVGSYNNINTGIAIGTENSSSNGGFMEIGYGMENNINGAIMLGSSANHKPAITIVPGIAGNGPGNVGIGTSSPGTEYMLDVNGNTHVSGTVVIGTGLNTPSGYNLYVATGVLTEKVKIANSGSVEWSDYVLGKNYKLMSIPDLAKYISRHTHLPGVPSAADVQKNGIDVAQMDATLMKKIEEANLYIIQQQKEIDNQSELIQQLQKGMTEQKAELDNMKKQLQK